MPAIDLRKAHALFLKMFSMWMADLDVNKLSIDRKVSIGCFLELTSGAEQVSVLLSQKVVRMLELPLPLVQSPDSTEAATRQINELLS